MCFIKDYGWKGWGEQGRPTGAVGVAV